MEILLFFGLGSLAVVLLLVIQMDTRVRQLEKNIKILESRLHVTEPHPPTLQTVSESTIATETEPQAGPAEPPSPPPVQPPSQAIPPPSKPAPSFQTPDIAFWDRAIGVVGLGVLVLGVGFGAVYAGIHFDAIGRFFLLLAGACSLFVAGWLMAQKDYLKDLCRWLRSAGGAVLLLAAVGSSSIEGLRWIDSEAVGYALLGAGIAVNLALGFYSRLTHVTILHHILSLVALLVAEQNLATLLSAFSVSLASLALSGWRKSSGAAVTAGLAFTAFLIFWSQAQEGAPTLFSIESAAFVIVYGSTIGMLSYRNESFADGGRLVSILLILGAAISLIGGYVVLRDLRLFTPLFLSQAVLAGSSLGLRYSKLPLVFRETLGALVYISVLAAIAALPSWDIPISFLPLVLTAGLWTMIAFVQSSTLQLKITRLGALAVLPWLSFALLPIFYEGLSAQLAHPALLMIPSLAMLNKLSKEESTYFQIVSGLGFLSATLLGIDSLELPFTWAIPALWFIVALLADIRRQTILTSIIGLTFIYACLDFLPGYSTKTVSPLDPFPHLFIMLTGFWWMGRSVFGNKRWVSSVAGALIISLAFAVILEKWHPVLQDTGVLLLLSAAFVFLELLSVLIRQRPIWGLDAEQLRVWRILSEVTVLFFAIQVYRLVQFDSRPPVLWLWATILASLGAIWRLPNRSAGDRLIFAAALFLGFSIDALLPESFPASAWMALAGLMALVSWHADGLRKPVTSAAAGLFYWGLLAWLLLAFNKLPPWPYQLVAVTGGLGFCVAALFEKTSLPSQHVFLSAVVPLAGVTILVLGFQGESGAPSLILLFLGMILYLLALFRDMAMLRIAAFVVLAATSLRLLLVDFSEGDFGLRALVFLISGGLLTGLSFFARVRNQRRKASVNHQG